MSDVTCAECGGPYHEEADCPPERFRERVGSIWCFDGQVYVNDNGWRPLGNAEAGELERLREQVTTLQTRGSELVKENQARHVAVVALEEMKHEYGNAAERAAMAERVIHKMMQASGTSTLTRAENIYVALLVERRDQRQGD